MTALYTLYTQEPQERRLGQSFTTIQQGGQCTLVKQWNCCYDIDLMHSLEQLLNNEAIYEQVYV